MGKGKIRLFINNSMVDSTVFLGYIFLKEAIKVLKSKKKRFALRKALLDLVKKIDFINDEYRILPQKEQEKVIGNLKEKLGNILALDESGGMSFFNTSLLINTLSLDVQTLRKHLLVLIASLYFLEIKEMILEAKREGIFEELVFKSLGMNKEDIERFREEASPVEKLKLQYDLIDTIKPYTSRVAIAKFSEQLEEIFQILDRLIEEDKQEGLIEKDKQEKIGVEIKKIYELLSSQFQNILFESVKQSDTSLSGEDYESRIEELLIASGIPKELIRRKIHEGKNGQEHDFLIDLNNIKISIGAKRTQRERYKQYRPEKGIDVSIVFTLGIDLTEDKVKTITEDYDSYIFIADEVYEQKEFLRNNEKVKKVSEFPEFIKKFLS